MSDPTLGRNGVDDLAEVPDHVDDVPVAPTPLDEDTSEPDDTDLDEVLAAIAALGDEPRGRA